MQDADNVMIAGNGDFFTAPTGTALPTDPVSALDEDFAGVGYISEDGATFRDEKTKEPIPVWQSFYPIKYRVTDSSAELEMVLKQFDVVTVPLAFGGGEVVEVPAVTGPPAIPLHYRYEPPDPDEIDERAGVLDWLYDGFKFRLVVPRLMVTGSTETQLARLAESDLPLTLGVLGTPGVKPWVMYTTHPAFEAAA